MPRLNDLGILFRYFGVADLHLIYGAKKNKIAFVISI